MGSPSLSSIKHKLNGLVQLAKRPGYATEGEIAKQAAIRISLKYNIPCEFTQEQFRRPYYAPSYAPQRPQSVKVTPVDWDAELDRFKKELQPSGWLVSEVVQTKVGRQMRFRKAGLNEEIRVTQRKNGDGLIFDIEHIIRPDIDAHGYDKSSTAWMGISLVGLLNHIGRGNK